VEVRREVRQLLGQLALRRVELALHLLPPADVPHRSAQLVRPALVISDKPDRLAEPDDAAVRRDDAVLALDVVSLHHAASAARERIVAIFGMDTLGPEAGLVEPARDGGSPASPRRRG
jgi:hypothetical protein